VAQPDEAWNFQRGDGLEKAFCLAAILKARHPDAALSLDCRTDGVVLEGVGLRVAWPSRKGLEQRLSL
jgi:hypothetical protein